MGSSDAYVVVAILVAGFLSSIPEAERAVAAMVQAGADENRAGFTELSQKIDRLGADSIVVKAHNEEAAKNLSIILKKRGFDSGSASIEIRNLATRVTDGELLHADIVIRGNVLYWAARIHSGDITTIQVAKGYREQLNVLKPDFDIRILDALILNTENKTDDALRILRDIDSPDGRAALLVVLRKQSIDAALEWFDNQPNRDNPSFLTGNGWSNVSISLAERDRWEEAAT